MMTVLEKIVFRVMESKDSIFLLLAEGGEMEGSDLPPHMVTFVKCW